MMSKGLTCDVVTVSESSSILTSRLQKIPVHLTNSSTIRIVMNTVYTQEITLNPRARLAHSMNVRSNVLRMISKKRRTSSKTISTRTKNSRRRARPMEA